MFAAALTAAVVSMSSGSSSQRSTIRTSYEIVVDRHISEIMPLFWSDELNWEWNTRLSFQRMIHTREYGQLVYQHYALPWPLATRDTLLSCDRRVHDREARVTSTCRSVQHDGAPVTTSAVRMELTRTAWEVVALPGEKTSIHLDLEMPADVARGVPKQIVNYC